MTRLRWWMRSPLPWQWVPRRFMPQIDEADYTALIEWLMWKRIEFSQSTMNCDQIQFRQHVDFNKVHTMPPENFNKPIWVSMDGVVLDGNHRAMAHKIANQPVDCIVIGLPFAAAVGALFSFRGTYDYAQRRVQHAAF